MTSTSRLPDFIIIGAMKSGTSSLHSWLADQPECSLPALKEPNFFSDEPQWRKGVAWYSELFAKAPPGTLTGEASVRYTSPNLASTVAGRMAATVPDVRLIYLVRHPLKRIQSHYRQWVLSRWGEQSLVETLRNPRSEFLGRSLYHTCLRPYIEAFPRERICVVRFEDLVADPHSAWYRVLDHLGLPHRNAPGTAHNVSESIPRFPEWFIRLRRKGLLRPVKRWPRPVRETGRKMLARALTGRERHDDLLERSREQIPDDICQRIWEDVSRLEDWLGVERPLWDRNGGSG